MSEKKPIGWLHIRRQLNGWSKPALIGLVKDLYDASSGNRDFLQARFGAPEDAGAMLEKYREKIVKIGWGYGDSLGEQVDRLEAGWAGE